MSAKRDRVADFVQEVGGIIPLPPVEITSEVFMWGGGHVGCYSHTMTKRDIWEELCMATIPNEDARWWILLHELIHATGHLSRLCRPTFNLYDLPPGEARTIRQRARWYMSREELIANLGAWYLHEALELKSSRYTDIMLARITRRCEELEWDHKVIQEAKDCAEEAKEFILA